MQDYQTFLKRKLVSIPESGFSPSGELNKNLFPFQKQIVGIALKKGKYAIFADCGLGKTLMQLEWAHQVVLHTDKPVLILAPLAVSGQTIKEGEKFGIEVFKLPIHGTLDIVKTVYISNYEQLENIDTALFSGVVLDESSILKNFTGVYKNLIIDRFKGTPYKLACTATPAPNDLMEIANHSEFLGIKRRSEILATYFVHDGGDTAKWRLKGHAENDFYGWIASWASVLRTPADIGFDSDGYNLPPLNYFEKQIKTDSRNNGKLFNDTSVNATDFNKELRLTIVPRIEVVAEIVNASDENFIIWVNQNEEEELLLSLIPDAKAVRGSETIKAKEEKLLGFANNEFRVLVTKKKIAQFGLNYQNCRNQVFASLDFSFEGLYQAIRRSYRFGQKNEVNIWLVTTDTMTNVLESINLKQSQFHKMMEQITKQVNQKVFQLKSDYDLKKHETEFFTIYNGDSCEVMSEIETESIGISVFSPPFADLYTYTDSIRDLGNSKDYNEFLEQFGFIVGELHRVMISGRNVCVHCMDLPIQKGKEGFIGLRDFSGMILRLFEKHGFVYHSRVTIWKDPVVEMQRTKALGLLHKQIKKDSTMSRVGIPDYVLIFRKDGERNNPVSNTSLPVDLWQKYASPVWMDINYGRTLQGFANGREDKDEKHIAPLQLETIERLIHLYSNEGDMLFTPFMGIGSEVYQAVKMNRKGIGIELKESYFELAKKNLQAVLEEKKQLTIF